LAGLNYRKVPLGFKLYNEIGINENRVWIKSMKSLLTEVSQVSVSYMSSVKTRFVMHANVSALSLLNKDELRIQTQSTWALVVDTF
jgi:hypothetical protein